MVSSVLTVTQVNTFLKSLIEGDGRLKDFFIQGEISNFTNHYKSGHFYFSLKDKKSVIKAVMFSSAAQRLKFMPEDGMKVIIRGSMSVYEPSGQYQLYALDIQPDGVGALSLAFEQLKEKLELEGLFDVKGKRALPVYPSRVAVITSGSGAAVQDILHITGRRWPIADIDLYAVAVQGKEAPVQLVSALKKANASSADVIIIGRGGGSYEDLQAFNDETLAREIAASGIPVVSAVGHETDFTIADFVADVRASTPSAAAELVTPDITDELSKLASYAEYFSIKPGMYVEYLRQSLDYLVDNSVLASPDVFFEQYKIAIDILSSEINELTNENLSKIKSELALNSAKLDALSPLKLISQGYSVVTDRAKKKVTSVLDVSVGDDLTIKLSDGSIEAKVLDIREEERYGKGNEL